MRKSFMVVLSLLMSAALIGCGRRESTPAPSRLSIAVIPKGTTHEFWKSIHAGAIKASRELDVDIIWKGPLKEDDREAQISVVEDFVSRGISGIVLAPLDDAALRAPVAGAVRSGIPVVIIDSGLNSEAFISFVATDNYRGGKLAGNHLASLLDGKGRVIMLRYQEGSASTAQREQGFLDAIKERQGIEVASDNQYGGATTETAYQASENLLSRFETAGGGLSVDGIFCPNESTTFGMLRALQDNKQAGKVRFAGFDSSAKLVEALDRGQIDALVLQNPFRMGYLGVKIIVDHLRGKSVEKRVDTGAVLVTRDNARDPEIRELLEPDLLPWLNK